MAGDTASFAINLDGNLAANAKKANASLGGLDSGLKSAGSSAEGMGSSAEGAAGGMEAMGGVATIAAGAVLAVATAIGATILTMADMSIKAHEAEEAQLALASAEYGHGAAAQAAVDAEYAVAASTSLTQQAVFDLSDSLERAGVSSKIFGSTLQAMADTSSVAGDAALKSIEKVIKKTEQLGTFKVKDADLKGTGIKMTEVYDQLASDMGISVAKVKQEIASGKIAAETGVTAINEVLEKKFGGEAAKKALSFDNQIDKFKQNLTNLFKDVDTGPFLAALHQLLGLFDSTTTTGKAMKGSLTDAMNSFFKAAAKTIPYVEAFLLGVGIGALDVYISMKPAIKQIETLFNVKGDGTTNGLKTATNAGKDFAVAVAWVAANVAGAMAAIGIAIAAPILIFDALNSAAKAVGNGIVSGFKKAQAFLQGLDFGSIASGLIDGLVNGIKAGAAKAIGAVKNLGSDMVKAGKESIGMASPAKAFINIGQHGLGEGLVQGIGASKQSVNASVKSLIDVKGASAAANDNASNPWKQRSLALPKSQAAGAKGSASSITIEKGAVTIHIDGSKDPKETAAAVEEVMVSVFERWASAAGSR